MGRLRLSKEYFTPMMTRDEWGAVEADHQEWYLLELPITYVRFCFEDLLTRFNTIEHIKALREFQRHNMTVEGFGDIKHNFFVSGEGMIYEGSGFYEEPPKLPKYATLKYKCLEIAFVGDYTKKDPTWPALRSAMQIIMWGLKNNIIEPSFKIIPLRDHLE